MNAQPFESHRGWKKVFRSEGLTFGIIGPIEGYPDTPGPQLESQDQRAGQAEAAGFGALWLRDVPFEDPTFGDLGQIHDPMVYAGWLAAHTKEIAIGTAGIVAPLRNPVEVAKQAASLDGLTGGRFILGLSSGDRPAEYPAFGVPFDDRADRLREARTLIGVLTETSYPSFETRHFGRLTGDLDLFPKPVSGTKLPILAIGRGGQTIDWIAENMDGWIWHYSDPRRLPEVIALWRKAAGPEKPYGYGTFFHLDRDADAPLQPGRGLAGGRKALTDFWLRQRDEGVAHVALNLKPLRRAASEMLDEFAEHIIPRLLR